MKDTPFQVPLVISTGMSEMVTVERVYSLVRHPVGILQCTSAYPAPPDQVNLNVIDTYRRKFPNAVIGGPIESLPVGEAIECDVQKNRTFSVAHAVEPINAGAGVQFPNNLF